MSTVVTTAREMLREAGKQAKQQYRETIERLAAGEAVAPEDFLETARLSGVPITTAHRHMEALESRLQAAEDIQRADGETEELERLQAKATEARERFHKIKADLEAQIKAAEREYQAAKNAADRARSQNMRLRGDATKTLAQTADPAIDAEIQRLHQDIKALQHERAAIHLTPELTARHPREAERLRLRYEQIPGEIAQAEARIAELQARKLDPLGGMDWGTDE